MENQRRNKLTLQGHTKGDNFTNESQNAAVSLVQQSEDLQASVGERYGGSPPILLFNDTNHANSIANPVSPISRISQPYKTASSACLSALDQWFLTFLASGTEFCKGNLSTNRGGGGFRDDSSVPHSQGHFIFIIITSAHLRSSGHYIPEAGHPSPHNPSCYPWLRACREALAEPSYLDRVKIQNDSPSMGTQRWSTAHTLPCMSQSHTDSRTSHEIPSILWAHDKLSTTR